MTQRAISTVGAVYYRICYSSKTVPTLRAARLQRVTWNGWRTWSLVGDPPDINWKCQSDCGWSETAEDAIANEMLIAMRRGGTDFWYETTYGEYRNSPKLIAKALSLEEFAEVFDRLRDIAGELSMTERIE
ncbi:MAG TPA: hypothetical protein ENH62_09965 [Marinobacter sp.]|uniref:Uncharacterized protein n=1 Tax=marine sediment metagenome TaxID=412755 RepID=A0A0F9SN25_9ZZZZ|nr:hypothetical protein [Marinobacter sp.]